MKLVVDTSVLVDHLRGDERALKLLADAVRDGDELWCPTVVRVEVLAGMRPGEEPRTRLLLSALRWRDLDSTIADRAAELARRYRRAHPGVDLPDYVVAATALALGARLLTLNVRHFPMFSGLVPPYA